MHHRDLHSFPTRRSSDLMSNTRNTPVEVLEMEYPLRVRSYALRRGSGGAGRWTGGEGVIREFMALAPVEARDRKSTRLNSSHTVISYAVFCLKKKKNMD